MKDYIQILIWLMIFVVIIELIFPSSDLKKYLKLVLGFIVIYVVLQPIMALFSTGEAHYRETLRGYQTSLEVETGIQQEMALQQEKIKDIYSRQYSGQMEQLIKSKVKVAEAQVEVEIALESGVPTITSVSVIVREEGEKDTGAIFIPKIHIGNKAEDLGDEEEKLEKEIKTCLNDFYNLDKANIYITVQKN